MRINAPKFKQQAFLFLTTLLVGVSQSYALNLQVELKNTKAARSDVKSAEALVRSLDAYFPFLSRNSETLKLNICGTGGPACNPENSYQFDSNTINLELTSYASSGEIKYKPGALQVLAHEYGHYVFVRRAADRHKNYDKLFAAVKYKIDQDKKLVVAKSKNLVNEIKEIENEFEKENETIKIASNYFYGSYFYQEVFSDLLTAIHFNNPDIMCLALDGTSRCTSPSSSVRRFSVLTSIEVAKEMTLGNPQGQHSALAPTRKGLWQKYQSLLKTGNSKEFALNFLLELMVDESYKVIFGEKSYSLEEMNTSLLHELQTYGK